MRNFLLAALTAAALYGAGLNGAVGQSASEGRDRWMLVRNQSELVAHSVYIIPAGRDCCWSRDLLEDIVIPRRPKERRSGSHSEEAPNVQMVNFDDGRGTCEFDIRITTGFQGWEWLFPRVNVCRDEVRKKGITLEGKSPSSNDDKNRWMTVENQSRLTARNIYIIPSKNEDCCWSRDLLPVSEIARNSRFRVKFDDGSGQCEFDIRIVSDRQGTEWRLDKVNVCEIERIVLRQMRLDNKRRVVTIKNESQDDAINVFTIPDSKDCCWSHDLLGDKIVPRRKSLDVNFDVGSSECNFEYRITKGSNRRDWTGKVDVCSNLPTISLK